MRNFKGNKKGFTLAEMALTAAMVGIMGAAAATATTDTASSARQVMLESLAEVLSKASQMNQNDMNDDNTSGININTCGQIGALVEGGVLPDTFAFDASFTGVSTFSGTEATNLCTISTNTTPRQDATFIGFGINNGPEGSTNKI
jgi:prepilin-type N-terminal cleavage/methylation domain-containing protein